MAMISDALVDRCLGELQRLITDEVVMLLGVKNELQRLQEKLRMIKAVLVDAERRRIQDEAVKLWLSKLKDVMYDADDIIDLCRIKGPQFLLSSKLPSSSSSTSPQLCYRSCGGFGLGFSISMC